jgi:hypothetical protein
MEVLQMVKFSLKTQRLDFMAGWITLEADILDSVDDETDLLCQLALEEQENGFDDVIAVLGQVNDDD